MNATMVPSEDRMGSIARSRKVSMRVPRRDLRASPEASMTASR